MNFKQVTSLKISITKYLDEKYKDVHVINYINDLDYLDKFDKKVEDTDDPLKAMFIFPNGKLKRIKLDLTDFKINDIYDLNLNINNIYDYLNLDHEEIKYIGFNLDSILQAGCIRVSNNLEKGELDIGMDLRYHKPNTKMLKIIDELLFYYKTILVDFIADRKGTSYVIHDDTIKDITKDINLIYNKIHI